MTRNKTTQENFFKWLDDLEEHQAIPGRMIHLGEFYSFIYPNRKRETTQTRATKPFLEWLKKFFYKELAGDSWISFEEWLNLWCTKRNYVWEPYRDWFGEGFLFRIKRTMRLDEY